MKDEAAPYRSVDLIPRVSGVNALLDGHSHSEVEMEMVKDKDGKNVLLTQTGTKIKAFGKLTISESGEFSTELVRDYEKKDPDTEKAIAEEKAKFEETLNRVVGKSDYELCINDENGNRIVRNAETNLGDFIADAYKYVAESEIGFANGGGVRNTIPAGDITFGQLLDVNPFSNSIICMKVKGQAIADALEFAVSSEPEESGGFLQVSGLTFTINMDKKADITVDDNGLLVSINGDERRVENIMVNGEPLDYEREYTVSGTDYLMLDKGDGHTEFTGEVIEMPYVDDVQALET